MSARLTIFDANWSIDTAGPSPTGYRTEIFLYGCHRAANGVSCPGCFNKDLWDNSTAIRTYSPQEAFEIIAAHAPSKYITFGGGEPLDQMMPLAELCRLLKQAGFHVMVYTGYIMQDLVRLIFDSDIAREAVSAFNTLLSNVDIIVDGPYIESERIYDSTAGDGFRNSIGSGNQIVWDFAAANAVNARFVFGYRAADLYGLMLDKADSLAYILDDRHKNVSAQTLRRDFVRRFDYAKRKVN